MRKAIVLAAFTVTTVSGSQVVTLPIQPAGDCIQVKTFDSPSQIVTGTMHKNGRVTTFVVQQNSSEAFVSRGWDGWAEVGNECPK